MIKAILVDDEATVRKNVRALLKANFEGEVVAIAEADGVASGLEILEQLKPDLVFLDIDMGDGTGFDLLTKTKYKNFDIIFVTGFDHHAIKAIKVGALDYILKPIDEEEFVEAVRKIVAKDKHETTDSSATISADFFKGTDVKRIVLKTSDVVYAVYEDDIIYCKSDGNYTTVYTEKDKIMVSKSIKHFEEVLSTTVFVRCHQSYLVNRTKVSKYDKQGYFVVNEGVKVPVSSRRKDYAFKRVFE